MENATATSIPATNGQPVIIIQQMQQQQQQQQVVQRKGWVGGFLLALVLSPFTAGLSLVAWVVYMVVRK